MDYVSSSAFINLIFSLPILSYPLLSVKLSVEDQTAEVLHATIELIHRPVFSSGPLSEVFAVPIKHATVCCLLPDPTAPQYPLLTSCLHESSALKREAGLMTLWHSMSSDSSVGNVPSSFVPSRASSLLHDD